jgi:hypothetical protein
MFLTVIRVFYKNRIKLWGKSYESAASRRITLISVLRTCVNYQQNTIKKLRCIIYRNLCFRLFVITNLLCTIKISKYFVFTQLYLAMYSCSVFLRILSQFSLMRYSFVNWKQKSSIKRPLRKANKKTRDIYKIFKSLRHRKFIFSKSNRYIQDFLVERQRTKRSEVYTPIRKFPVLRVIPVYNVEEYHDTKKYLSQEPFWLVIRHTLTNLYLTLTDHRGHVIYSITPGQLGIKKR